MVHKQDALSNSHDPDFSESTLTGTEVIQTGEQTMEHLSDLPPETYYQTLDSLNQSNSPGVNGTFDASQLLKAHSEYRREQTAFQKSAKNQDDLVAFHLAKDKLIDAMDEALQILGVL